jgi:hypothetical protein
MFHSQYLPRSSIFNLIQAILALSLDMPILFIKLGRKAAFTVMRKTDAKQEIMTTYYNSLTM